MNKKIAIWGTGTLAKKFYCLYKDKSNITCFFDNDEKKHNTTLFDIPIKKWTPSNGHKIIIASMYWKEISNQLMASGLCIGKDFEIYSKYLEIGGAELL